MITEKHLSIVRAALTFWDEEMGSVDRTIYEHYLHSNDQGTHFAAGDVATTRCYFNNVELRSALIDKVTGKFDSERPVDSADELSHQVDRQARVVVLVPTQL